MTTVRPNIFPLAAILGGACMVAALAHAGMAGADATQPAESKTIIEATSTEGGEAAEAQNEVATLTGEAEAVEETPAEESAAMQDDSSSAAPLEDTPGVVPETPQTDEAAYEIEDAQQDPASAGEAPAGPDMSGAEASGVPMSGGVSSDPLAFLLQVVAREQSAGSDISVSWYDEQSGAVEYTRR